MGHDARKMELRLKKKEQNTTTNKIKNEIKPSMSSKIPRISSSKIKSSRLGNNIFSDIGTSRGVKWFNRGYTYSFCCIFEAGVDFCCCLKKNENIVGEHLGE